jgi:NADH-quinone oxidoreductase subunit F
MSLEHLEAKARETVALYEFPKAATLPLLWLVQEDQGYVSLESEAWVAEHVGVRKTEVREVVSFYTMFHTQPVGRRELKICTSLPCLMRGAGEVMQTVKDHYGISPGETTEDGLVTLTEVECLCACEMSPMGQLDEDFVGPFDPETLEATMRAAEEDPKSAQPLPEPDPYITSDGPILSKHFDAPGGTWIEDYIADGGYEAAKKALGMSREDVIEEVLNANLRGLGGAGFPAGRKWSFIPKNSEKPVYLVANADEGEPGTFKDRYLMERDPHALLEGMLIAAHAIGSNKGYIYVRGEYFRPAKRMQRAIEEAKAAGWLGENIQGTGFDLDIVVHRGAGAYICGEETALLSSLEGGKGQPRLKPPFPAISGLFSCPTIVNNVETLSCVPFILKNGAEKFVEIGNEKQGGTRLFCVSGHVKRPGVYEAPVSITLRELIEGCGQGMREGSELKAIVPGGISARVLTANEIDVEMDFDSIMKAGSMAGSGGVMVMDDSTCMVEALASASRFYAHESCGQCSPCREGTGWVHRILTRIMAGEGTLQDIDDLVSIATDMEGKTICVFADAAAWPVQSYIAKFRSEFEEFITSGRKIEKEEAASCPS